MPISTIRANAHRSYVSVSAAGRRGRRAASDESLFMRRISRVVEVPLDDVIALFDEFRIEETPALALRGETPAEGAAAPIREPAPKEEGPASVEEQAAPIEAAIAEGEAQPPEEAAPPREASAGEQVPAMTEPPVAPAAEPTEAAAPQEEAAEPVGEQANAEAAVKEAPEAQPEMTSAERVAAMRAARRRMRSRTAAQTREPRAEEEPIFIGTAWTAEPDDLDEPASFMARAEAALSLPDEPLLARIAYEQNSAIFLDEDEAAQQPVEASPQETSSVEAELRPDIPEAVEPPVEAFAAEEPEPPVREMIEEELEAESHISSTGATVNVYRMYDTEPATETKDEPAGFETTIDVEAEPYDIEATATYEAEPCDAEPTAGTETGPYEFEAALELLEPEPETGDASSLPARTKPWPWEESGDLSLEEALEALEDKELSGLTTEIVTNTVEGALKEGAVKSLCRRYSLRLQAVYNAILRESKRRISRMNEKHHAPAVGTDSTIELGMRMAKKLLAADMHHKRTWFQSPFPEADGRYYIIQSHKVEDEKLPTEFPTERVHYEELGDGWAISVGY